MENINFHSSVLLKERNENSFVKIIQYIKNCVIRRKNIYYFKSGQVSWSSISPALHLIDPWMAFYNRWDYSQNPIS